MPCIALYKWGLPVLVIGAGLPNLLSAAIDAKSYAERFSFNNIGALSPTAAKAVLTTPFIHLNIDFQDHAVNFITQHTACYPYFLQAYGKLLWDCLPDNTKVIDLAAVETVLPDFINELDNGFYEARYANTTEEERKFMHCMAQQSDGPIDTQTIKQCLNKSAQHVGQYRSRLIEKGLIFSTQHGKIDFTVPQFGSFLRRRA